VKLFSFWRSLATFRVRIALNLKKIESEVVNIDLMKGHQRLPEYQDVNPLMVIPALIDGEGPVLFESLAIIEYLDERFPQPPLLPSDLRARARVRGLAQIVACDAHPLVVPRVRNYLAQEIKLDEAGTMKWCRHWASEGLKALEAHLSRDQETGTYCHGNQITVADLCLVSQAVGGRFFEVDMTPFPTVARIAEACLKQDAFARAHPLEQPGAPKSVSH
jgi:maleylacetoacetate isomerase